MARSRWLCSWKTSSPLSLILLLLLLSTLVSGAWQEISDYTDCGSTNFRTQQILVDFNEDSYWLNISIEGDFPRQVIDYSTVTNLASIHSPLIYSLSACIDGVV